MLQRSCPPVCRWASATLPSRLVLCCLARPTFPQRRVELVARVSLLSGRRLVGELGFVRLLLPSWVLVCADTKKHRSQDGKGRCSRPLGLSAVPSRQLRLGRRRSVGSASIGQESSKTSCQSSFGPAFEIVGSD